MRPAAAALLAALLMSCALAFDEPTSPPTTITLTKLDDRVRVAIDDELFTEYLFSGHSRPVLYPVVVAGEHVTRSWPIADAREHEEKDHPHHRSLWFSHGNVNGHDFWAEGGKRGRIEHVELIPTEDAAALKSRNRWVAHDGTVVCTDVRTLRFATKGRQRTIDYDVTIHASHGEVRLGDTKEGTMAIRSVPALRLRGPAATGRAVNSEGVGGKAVWGKRAAWVHYHGTVGGKALGFAIFDHPDNFAHPTWWHARDYGLVAANPFGVHDFERKPKGTGDRVIAKGESLTLRYRFLFHEGEVSVAEEFRRYSERP